MGSVKKALKKTANVATGGIYGAYKDKKEAKRAERKQRDAVAQAEAEAKKQQEINAQEVNKVRQESADLASLEQDAASAGDEMGGMLTGPEGLVEDRKLSKRKKLGG